MMEMVYYCNQMPHTKKCFQCGTSHTTPCDICYINGCPKCSPEAYIDSEIAVLNSAAHIEMDRRKAVKDGSS